MLCPSLRGALVVVVSHSDDGSSGDSGARGRMARTGRCDDCVKRGEGDARGRVAQAWRVKARARARVVQ